jgi:hypothetical protein
MLCLLAIVLWYQLICKLDCRDCSDSSVCKLLLILSKKICLCKPSSKCVVLFLIKVWMLERTLIIDFCWVFIRQNLYIGGGDKCVESPWSFELHHCLLYRWRCPDKAKLFAGHVTAGGIVRGSSYLPRSWVSKQFINCLNRKHCDGKSFSMMLAWFLELQVLVP